MSGHTSAFPFSRLVATAAGHVWPVLARARAFRARLALMRRAAETRRELGALDPRLLADIGLGRAEAAREAERWPWDLRPSRPGRGTQGKRMSRLTS